MKWAIYKPCFETLFQSLLKIKVHICTLHKVYMNKLHIKGELQNGLAQFRAVIYNTCSNISLKKRSLPAYVGSVYVHALKR